MDGPRDYIQISDRERQISYYFTYMQNLKNYTNDFVYKTEIDTQT